jgi:hypothetical protein
MYPYETVDAFCPTAFAHDVKIVVQVLSLACRETLGRPCEYDEGCPCSRGLLVESDAPAPYESQTLSTTWVVVRRTVGE